MFLYFGTCRGTAELRYVCVRSQKSTYPKLTENTIADVVVVGAGLTGRSHSSMFLDELNAKWAMRLYLCQQLKVYILRRPQHCLQPGKGW